MRLYRLCLRALCNRTPPRSFLLALCLLIPLALLAASCGSNSDSTAPEDPDPQNPVNTQVAGEDSSDTTTTEVSTPRSTTSAQSEPPSGNTAENNNASAQPAANQQSQVNQSEATAVSAGFRHTCALHQTGSISCWGNNWYGQLGDGTGGSEGDMSSVPVKVKDIDDATAISAGGDHSCALHQTGTISCWGSNWSGPLGDGTRDDSSVPVKVKDIDDATAVSTGQNHSCALHQNGTISCWGGWGGVGLAPVEIDGISDATAISAGHYDSCALHQTGIISCWGREAGSKPEQIDGISDATAVDAGSGGTAGGNSCALHQTGSVSCWGPGARSVPEEIDGISDATAISTGGWGHSCALHTDGNISCWGSNQDGQLGSNAVEFESSVPVGVMGISDATAISTGWDHSCALHQTGNISCWGRNEDGKLGDGTNNYSEPVKVQGIDDATAISAGDFSYSHSCALHNDGNISCWGGNLYGQLGNGTGGTLHDDSPVPVKVTGIDDAIAVSAGGGSNSCALHQTGSISCWGRNDFGQLGNDTGGNEGDMSLVPVKVQGIDDATAISTSWTQSCALHQNGTISCWGNNWYGQLGDGTGGSEGDMSLVPVKVTGIDDATAISTNWSHSCALHQTGGISCWGNSSDGKLGNGQSGDLTDFSSVPVKVASIDDAIAVSAGSEYSCALNNDGTISCWGTNYFGQLGDGTEEPSSVPVAVEGISDATAISTGWDHSCALHQTGGISCWGNSSGGKLGNGQSGYLTDLSSVPVKVVNIDDAIAISAGWTHSCALRQNSTIYCWGTNESGQLGDGTYIGSFLPRFVVGFGG